MTSLPQTKVCSKCGANKPLNEYSKSKEGKYGRRADCKVCQAKYKRKYRAKNKARRTAYMRRWRAMNPERAYEYQRQWREKNKEQAREYQKVWCEENREHILEYAREYREEHREERAFLQRQRNARKVLAEGDHTPEQLQARIDYYGGLCWMCGVRYEEIDHVIALSNGGSDWPANLRPACKSCNSSKRDRDWRLFVQGSWQYK